MTRHIKRGGKVWINVFPDKPVTAEAGRDPHGLGQGQPRALGRRREAGPDPVRAVLRRRRASPARPSSGPSRSCRSRPASSPARRRSDGEARTPTLRDLDDAELVERLAEAKEELFNLRFQHVTGQLDNTRRARAGHARTIARINTELRAREIAAAEALAAARRTPDGRQTTTDRRPRANRPQGPRGPRRLRPAWTRPPSSTVDRPRAPPAATTRRCSAPRKLYVHDEANDAQRRRPRPRRRRPARCRS